jgi:hypothetical protein
MCVSHLDPICYTAGRLHVCLHCVFVGQRDRLAAHSERTGHYLFVDVSSKHVYCHTCADYVYDGEFERISRRTRAECVNPRAGAAMNSPWLPPTAKDRTAFSRHMEQQPVISSSFTPGQSIPRPASHTPPLSERHCSGNTLPSHRQSLFNQSVRIVVTARNLQLVSFFDR